jgi:hypothetical protein
MIVVGGLIVGNPGDTRESVEANLEFARRYVDWPYIQHPTPYPGTPMTKDFRDRGLIINERLEEYDGTTAVVRTEHLSADEVEFLRWRAERWMKLRHMPAAFAHSPLFLLRNAPKMFAHTFREARSAHFSGSKTSARPSSASRPSGAPSAPTYNGRVPGGLRLISPSATMDRRTSTAGTDRRQALPSAFPKLKLDR